MWDVSKIDTGMLILGGLASLEETIYSHVYCIVYCALSDKEALQFASRHNINPFMGKGAFLHHACQQAKAHFCTTQLLCICSVSASQRDLGKPLFLLRKLSKVIHTHRLCFRE